MRRCVPTLHEEAGPSESVVATGSTGPLEVHAHNAGLVPASPERRQSRQSMLAVLSAALRDMSDNEEEDEEPVLSPEDVVRAALETADECMRKTEQEFEALAM